MRKLVFTLLALFSINAYADADWLSPGGMTQIMDGADDSTYHVPLGHSFPYYGGVFTDAWMSTNGFIMLYDPVNQFGNSNTWNSLCCSGQDLANNNYGGQFSFMLAPLWTDLIDLISSIMTLASIRPRPAPPYSSGISAAIHPSRVRASTNDSG